jgi:hypothetical protein
MMSPIHEYVLPLNMATIPEAIKATPRWVIWRAGPVNEKGKFPKIPVDVLTGVKVSANEPANWLTVEGASEAYLAGKCHGIGFVPAGRPLVMESEVPLYPCAIDLDGCGGELGVHEALWNSLGQPYFNVTVNGTVTLASGGTVSTNWTRVRTWTDGYTTLTDFTDDKYTVSGNGTLTRASGAVVNVSIPTTSPLVFAAGCRWIEAGTLVFTLPSGLTRSINYGNTAACDNQAVLTLPSGLTYTITMP